MQAIRVISVIKKRTAIWKTAFLLAGMITLYGALACAASAGSKADPSVGEPKRSYGSIDVIMYQTSW